MRFEGQLKWFEIKTIVDMEENVSNIKSNKQQSTTTKAMFGLSVYCPCLKFAFCLGVGPNYSGNKKTLKRACWNANWNWKCTVSLNVCACRYSTVLVSINTTHLLLVLWSWHNEWSMKQSRKTLHFLQLLQHSHPTFSSSQLSCRDVYNFHQCPVLFVFNEPNLPTILQ